MKLELYKSALFAFKSTIKSRLFQTEVDTPSFIVISKLKLGFSIYISTNFMVFFTVLFRMFIRKQRKLGSQIKKKIICNE